jgi:hypothetical protein
MRRPLSGVAHCSGGTDVQAQPPVTDPQLLNSWDVSSYIYEDVTNDASLDMDESQVRSASPVIGRSIAVIIYGRVAKLSVWCTDTHARMQPPVNAARRPDAVRWR